MIALLVVNKVFAQINPNLMHLNVEILTKFQTIDEKIFDEERYL